MREKLQLAFTFLILATSSTAWGQQSSIATALNAINKIGNGGHAHEEAIGAWKSVSTASVEKAPEILKAIKGDNPLAANWLRAALDQIVENHLKAGNQLPGDTFEAIVFDQDYAPRARRLAYEWLKMVEPDAHDRIMPKMLADSSLEMRRDAVAFAMDNAANLKGDAAIERYRTILTAARDLDQVEELQEKLKELGEEVNLREHFGFLATWKVVGPFDNKDKGGFNVAYGPEKDLAGKESYVAKAGEVRWIAHTSDDTYGEVDLNEVIGKHMGVAGYAYTKFDSAKKQDIELRLESKNANKIWLNGELVMENEVYHSGGGFDQYISKGVLKPGTNTILMKLCQNEQTDSWAQDWSFKVRVCDSLGTAVAPSK